MENNTIKSFEKITSVRKRKIYIQKIKSTQSSIEKHKKFVLKKSRTSLSFNQFWWLIHQNLCFYKAYTIIKMKYELDK